LHRRGVLHTFRPGDEVPDWALEHIRNPHVLGVAEDTAQPVTAPAAPSSAAGLDPVDPAPASGERPPENGPGATRQVWADYAMSVGVEVDAAWKREDIIAACAAAGR
ncbi:MAG TPA: hypothetical protein VK537_08495, partial [Galbitalea sp.]|nr:hypothetical protein [Galbitalea sp.]